MFKMSYEKLLLENVNWITENGQKKVILRMYN